LKDFVKKYKLKKWHDEHTWELKPIKTIFYSLKKPREILIEYKKKFFLLKAKVAWGSASFLEFEDTILEEKSKGYPADDKIFLLDEKEMFFAKLKYYK